MSNNNVPVVKNPLEAGCELVILKKGDTVYSLAERNSIGLDNYIVYLDGKIVENYDEKIKSGTQIVFVKKIEGGKKTGGLIAMLAVSAAAYFAAPVIAPALTSLTGGFIAGNTALFLTQTGMMIAGGMLVNNLFHKQPDLPKTSSHSPSYSFQEANPALDGACVPVVYGISSVKPPMVSSIVGTTSGVKTFFGYNSALEPYKTKIFLPGKDTANTANSLTMRMLLADHCLEKIHKIKINNNDLANYTNIFDLYAKYYGAASGAEYFLERIFDFSLIYTDRSRESWLEDFEDWLREHSYQEVSDDDHYIRRYRESLFAENFKDFGFEGCLLATLSDEKVFVLKYNPAVKYSYSPFSHDFPDTNVSEREIPDKGAVYWLEILASSLVEGIFGNFNANLKFLSDSSIFRIFSGYNLELPEYMRGRQFREMAGLRDNMQRNDFLGRTNHEHVAIFDEGDDFYLQKYVFSADDGKYIPGTRTGQGVVERIDFAPVLKGPAIEKDDSGEDFTDKTWNGYEMLFNPGGDYCRASFMYENKFLAGGYAHKQFHKTDGFCAFVVKNGEIVPGLDNTRLSSPVFDKKIYRQKLYPGAVGENPKPPEFLYIEPFQEEGYLEAGEKKAVYISLVMPQGLCRIANNGGNEFHEICLRFDVKTQSGSNWKLWGKETLRGDSTGSATVFVGPFNADHAKHEIYSSYLGGPAAGTDYPLSNIPPVDPGLYEIASLPVITEPFEIRVKFDKKPKLESRYREEVLVDTVYSYYDFDLQVFPGASSFDLKLAASDFSATNIPPITFLVERGKIKIKNNSGEELEVESSSPAWQLYDLMTNKEYGLGLPESSMVFESFQEWDEFCTENEIESHYTIDYQGSFDDIASPILTLGRANPVKTGNMFSVAVDRKETAVAQIFNEENIVAGSFGVEYLPEREKANIISIKFRDKNAEYAEKTVEYRYPGTIIENERRIDITLNNCVDYRTAWNHAVYLLKSNHYCRKNISFTAGIDAIRCQVGDVIAVNFRNIAWETLPGRIDRYLPDGSHRIYGSFEFDPENEYFILVQDQTTDEVKYSRIENTTTAQTPEGFIDIRLEASGELSENSVITIGTRNILKSLYRITSISRDSDFNRRITALEYNEKVYDKEPFFICTPPENPVIKLVNTSLSRRPFALTYDGMTAFDTGPAAAGDTSKGLNFRAWKAFAENGSVYICHEQEDNSFSEPAELCQYGSLVDHLNLTFDQNARPFLSWQGAGGVNIFYYNPVTGTSERKVITPGRHPVSTLDYRYNAGAGDSDILLFYMSELPDGRVKYRMQRDRYEIAYDTDLVLGVNEFLEAVWVSPNFRLYLYYSSFEDGKWEIKYWHSNLYPVPLEEKDLRVRTELVSIQNLDRMWDEYAELKGVEVTEITLEQTSFPPKDLNLPDEEAPQVELKGIEVLEINLEQTSFPPKDLNLPDEEAPQVELKGIEVLEINLEQTAYPPIEITGEPERLEITNITPIEITLEQTD